MVSINRNIFLSQLKELTFTEHLLSARYSEKSFPCLMSSNAPRSHRKQPPSSPFCRQWHWGLMRLTNSFSSSQHVLLLCPPTLMTLWGQIQTQCNMKRYLLEKAVNGHGGGLEVGSNPILLQGEGSFGKPSRLGQSSPLTHRVSPFKENNCHSKVYLSVVNFTIYTICLKSRNKNMAILILNENVPLLDPTFLRPSVGASNSPWTRVEKPGAATVPSHMEGRPDATQQESRTAATTGSADKLYLVNSVCVCFIFTFAFHWEKHVLKCPWRHLGLCPNLCGSAWVYSEPQLSPALAVWTRQQNWLTA